MLRVRVKFKSILALQKHGQNGEIQNRKVFKEGDKRCQHEVVNRKNVVYRKIFVSKKY